MAIWRIPSPGGRSGKLRVPISASGRVARHKTKTRQALSWVIGIVLLGSVTKFSETSANAQASLLDDNAAVTSTAAQAGLASPPASPADAAINNTTGPRTSAVVPNLDAEADKRQRDAAPRETADREAPAPGNPLWRMPLKQFSVTRERPIFSPSRRPPPAPTYVAPVAVKQPPKPREPERPTIALAGTIIGTDGYRGAVFRDTSSQDVLRLRVGENYQGWVLLLITQREARLVKNGEQALLELPVPAGTPPRVRSRQEIALEQIWAVGAE
jgi:hypothetical protein